VCGLRVNVLQGDIDVECKVKDKYKCKKRKGIDEMMSKRSRWSVRSDRIRWRKRSSKGKEERKEGGPLGQGHTYH
jgi:hypothetical protein